MPEDSEQTKECESGRDVLTQSVDLTAERSGGVYLVSLYDPHVWMLGERAHTQIWLPTLISHLCEQTLLFDS